MRAVALVAPGQVEIVDDWPEPEPGPGEVVVQIRGVGLCGSHLSIYDGARPVPGMPWVFGHEGGGDVVAVGSGVTDRHVGQRVAVPAGYTWPVSSDWPDVALACVEPLVVAHTAVRRANVPVGADCLVIGAGSQGQLVCQSLMAAGARPYVMEPHPGRLELAMKLGARPAEEHDGHTYPLVFETAGVPAVWEQAYNAVARTGKLVVIGFNDKPAQLTTIDLVQRQITIVGQLIDDHPVDFQATLAAVTAGQLAPEQIVQATFPVEQTAAALASVREIPGKSWIEFSTWRDGS